MGDRFKALFTADLHMYNALPHAKPVKEWRGMRGITDRFIDQANVLERIRDTALDEEVEVVFILGDLFDKRLLDAVTLRLVIKLLHGFPMPVLILPGNHDANNMSGDRFTVEAFAEMDNDNIQVLMDSPALWSPRPWLCFHSVPYGTLEANKQAVQKAKENQQEGTNILLLHNSVLGATKGGWTSDVGLDHNIMGGFQAVLSGHFHEPQTFGKRGMYIGAPMQLHFGEAGQVCRVVVATFAEKKQPAFKTIEDLGAPRFHVIQGNNLPVDVHSGDYLRMEHQVSHAEWERLLPSVKADVAKLVKQGIHAQAIHKPVTSKEERLKDAGGPGISFESMIKEYVQLYGEGKEGVDPKKLSKMGLEALEAARRQL